MTFCFITRPTSSFVDIDCSNNVHVLEVAMQRSRCIENATTTAVWIIVLYCQARRMHACVFNSHPAQHKQWRQKRRTDRKRCTAPTSLLPRPSIPPCQCCRNTGYIKTDLRFKKYNGSCVGLLKQRTVL